MFNFLIINYNDNDPTCNNISCESKNNKRKNLCGKMYKLNSILRSKNRLKRCSHICITKNSNSEQQQKIIRNKFMTMLITEIKITKLVVILNSNSVIIFELIFFLLIIKFFFSFYCVHLSLYENKTIDQLSKNVHIYISLLRLFFVAVETFLMEAINKNVFMSNFICLNYFI